jgi:predicted DNA-binding protein
MDQNTATLFIKISPKLESEIIAESKKIGLTKSSLVRLAIPRGIEQVKEQLRSSSEKPACGES